MAVAQDAARLVREPLTARVSAHEALRTLRGDDRPFALIGAWAGGGAVLGSDPLRVAGPEEDILARLDDLPSVDADTLRSGGGDAAEAVGAGLGGLRPAGGDVAGAVGGGWVGHLGFELRHAVEPGHPPPPRPVPLPDAALAFYDHVLRLDGAGRWWFEALWTPERAAALAQRRAELAARLAAPPPARPFMTSAWRWTPSPAAHAEAVEACRERIAAGDLVHANLCLRLDGRLDGSPLDLFAAAVEALPTEHAAFLAGPWGALGSLSPELFLVRRGRTVLSAPVMGTRPTERRAEPAASAKDRAENAMIVDLVRNDLGRVCRPGGVRVTAHAGVRQLGSDVEGELADGVRDADLVRAAFPPGSVTGAPKRAALDVIAELESTGREACTGAIGLASPLAGLELSVAVRTFEMAGDRIWLGVGGGVVADSDGVAAAREAAAQAAPLLAAIGAAAPDDALPPVAPPQDVGGPRQGADQGAPAAPRQDVGGPRQGADQGAPAAPRQDVGGPRQGADQGAPAAPPQDVGGPRHGAGQGAPAAPPRPMRRGPRPVPRPDPSAGLYETVLVADGRPLHLAEHLARLAASLHALYRRPLPPGLEQRIATAAAGAGAGAGRRRLRVDVTPALDVVIATGPPPAAEVAVLRPVVLAGGLGAHKWRDRRLLEAHEADDPATMPLLLDADGYVLEASRASVVVRAGDGRLYTPPADGRILPGTTRARLAPAERLLTLADLRAAPALYVASALRGLQPATLP